MTVLLARTGWGWALLGGFGVALVLGCVVYVFVQFWLQFAKGMNEASDEHQRGFDVEIRRPDDDGTGPSS